MAWSCIGIGRGKPGLARRTASWRCLPSRSIWSRCSTRIRISLPPPGGFDFGDVYFAHLHHGGEGALGFFAACGDGFGQDSRGDLPRDAPAVLAPAAFARFAAIGDDRVPIAVGFLLGVGRDLEGKGDVVFNVRAAVEADAGNAADRELDNEDVASLARGIVAGRVVDSRHFAIRKRGRIEARRVEGVLIKPEANRVFGNRLFHRVIFVRSGSAWKPEDVFPRFQS